MNDPLSSLALRNGVLANACVPAPFLNGAIPKGTKFDRDGSVLIDIAVTDGRIAAIAPASSLRADNTLDLQMRHAWPLLVDIHAHLDRSHIIGRARNAQEDFDGARQAAYADRATHWTREDLFSRMDFALQCSVAHGVSAVRTHLDSHPSKAKVVWDTFSEIARKWASQITLQPVALVPIDLYRSDYGAELADRVVSHNGILGGIVAGPTDTADLRAQLNASLTSLFAHASARNLDIDLHVDESADGKALPHVARATVKNGYEGRVICGHCCSLSLLPDDEQAATIGLLTSAGISVITLPTINTYLQDRKLNRTPRWRGVPPIKELIAGQVPVAIAGDNCRDPFHPYGDHDMLDTFRQAARIFQFEYPYAHATALIGPSPARIAKLRGKGAIEVGLDADLMILEAWSMDQVIARPHHDRRILRRGEQVECRLPSYATLQSHG